MFVLQPIMLIYEYQHQKKSNCQEYSKLNELSELVRTGIEIMMKTYLYTYYRLIELKI